MSTDDIVYILVLVTSIPLGLYIRQTKEAKVKQKLCSIVGFVLVLLTCRLHALHSLITTVVNCIIVKYFDIRYCHWVSFAWCFGYLLGFRTIHLLGIPSAPPLANAVQLLLTLKMVMVAFEVHESQFPLKERRYEHMDGERLKYLQEKYVAVAPSFQDIFLYAYCYIGMFTGPFYRYRTYVDMLNQDCNVIPWKEHAWNRLRYIPVLVTILLVVSHYFKKEYTQTDEFLDEPFWFRVFYIVPMFMVFRTRLYTAFLLSECMCMTAGLGGYPVVSKPKCGQGPTDLQALDDILKKKPSEIEYNFDTVYNLNIYGCELAPTSREGLKSWNMTIQSWLAHCVYKRFPIRSLGSTVTMTVSAFWHGIHPGYYLSFLTCVPILIAEDIWIDLYYKNASPGQQKLFNWVCWFFKMRFFDYMCMGFILLSWKATMHYWSSIYFLIHFIIAAFLVTGLILKSSRHKKTA
ncbi:lysophospholipid acyltransferase 7-like [Liolophura sinensis]|uniref:lysophospholipid acyltransferase 7-like n=1 Tax=Liolophura sinensis TaxID=3198878 RepID=UPI003158E94F